MKNSKLNLHEAKKYIYFHNRNSYPIMRMINRILYKELSCRQKIYKAGFLCLKTHFFVHFSLYFQLFFPVTSLRFHLYYHAFLQAKVVQRTGDSCLSTISMAKPQCPFGLIMHKVKQRLTVHDQSKLAILSVIYIEHTRCVYFHQPLHDLRKVAWKRSHISIKH